MVEENGLWGGVFWSTIIAIGLTGLLYLAFKGYVQEINPILFVGMLFSITIIIAIFFAKEIAGTKSSKLGSFTSNSNSFVIGFLFWSLLMIFSSFGGQQSLLSVGQNNFYSSVSNSLPQLTDFLMTVFVIPAAEAIFFIIGLPLILQKFLDALGNVEGMKFLKNPILQLFIIIVISSILFALFHTGKQFIAFIIAAVTFRSITVLSVWEDISVDLIGFIDLAPGFSLGAHIANNWFFFGFSKGVNLIIQNFLPMGIIVLLIILFLSFAPIKWIYNLLDKAGLVLGSGT